MTISHAKRRLVAALSATILGGTLLAMAGSPADAATVANTDILGSGSSLHFSPNGLNATLPAPAQCPGAHAAISITNLTLAKETIEYYGGDVSINSGTAHLFCIGGTANDYDIEYQLLGTRQILLVHVQ
jgi:hypothetical protein